MYNPHSNSTFSSDGSQTSGSPRNLYSRGGGGGGLVSPTSNHFQHSSSYASRTTPVTASSGGNLSANSHGDFNGPQSASSFNSNIHGPSSTTTTPLSGNMNVNLNKDGSLISPPGSTISNQNQVQGGSSSATMRMDNNNNSNVINNNLPLNSPSGFSNGSNKTPTLGSISQSQTIPSPSLINNSNLNEDPPRNGESSSSSSSSKDPSNQSSSTTNAASSSTSTSTTATSSSSSNPYKSFRVTLDDPCHKVLPAALKKYKIVDDWRLYALFICYGNTERCLSYDEKPLLLFQKLKEAKMNPVFMLRHIRDVKSPLEIAEGKAKARKGDKDKDSSSGGKDTNSSAVDGKDKDENGNNRVKNAIAKLSSKDLKKEFENSSSSTSNNNSVSNASKDDQKEKKEEIESLKEEDIEDKDLISEESPKIMGPANQLPSADSIISSSTSTLPSLDNSSSTVEPSSSTSTSTRSYAISIYPYVSEREDEFDVGVGDTFVVLSKAKGWWVVQRDSKANGKGDVDLVGLAKDDDKSGKVYKREIRSGWVPAGCLLETKIPLGNLTRKRNQSNLDDNGEEEKNRDGIMDNTLMSKSDSSSTVTAESIVEDGEVDQEGLHSKSKSISKISIPPSIITSTSTPGIMLMDYNSATRSSSSEKSSTESSTTTNSTANPDLPSSSTTTTTTTNTSILNLKKEDKLRVFKRYNHWSYCVLENGNHDRGWVPSWYIGRSGRSSSGGGGGSGSGSGFKDKEKEKEKSSAVKDREKEKEDQKEKSGGGLENLEGKDKTIEISEDTQVNSSTEGSSGTKNQAEDGKEEKVAD